MNSHAYYMQRAIALAKKGQYTTRPNPCVGCVIVKDGQIVGEGYHYQAGQPHAEVFALRQAGENAKDAVVYVTLEPCSHHGRTPPCADALIQAQVKTVVIAVADPNPKVAGGGITQLKNAGIDVIVGVCQAQALTLNQGFFKVMQHGLPFVRVKIACSLDGRIAMSSGESKWITGEAARQDVQHLRALSGAIITGSQTILLDKPQLNVRSQDLGVPLADIPQPRLVVLDRRGRISEQHDWYIQQSNRTVQLVHELGDGSLGLETVLRDLAHEGINDVLVEAGATLATAFISTNLVDEVIIYQAPCLLGISAHPMFLADIRQLSDQYIFDLLYQQRLGNDNKFIYQPLR